MVRGSVFTSVFGTALVAMLASTLVGCSAESEGTVESTDGETSEDEGELRGGTRLSPSEVASLVRQAGFPSSLIGRMVCTAKWESSFYTAATHRNRNGSTDRGLFQINSIHVGGTRGCPSSASALFDPTTNTRCAYAIYKLQGINAWYGYRAHRSECDRYRVGNAPLLRGDSLGGIGDALGDAPAAHDEDADLVLQAEPEPISHADMYGDAYLAEVWAQTFGPLWWGEARAANPTLPSDLPIFVR